MKPISTLRPILAALGAAVIALSSASAQSTWNGSSSALWSGNNWDTAPTNGSALTFSGTTNQTNTNDTALTNIGLLTLTGANWNIGLGTLTLNSGITASGTSALSGTLTLGAAQTWENSTGTLSISGTIANGGNLLTVRGDGNTSISSIISGTGGLTTRDAGTLTLSGANTYTGTTLVTFGGTLNLTGNRTADAGAITVDRGGTLNISNSNFSIGGNNTFFVGSDAGTNTVSTVNHTAGTISTGTVGGQLLIGNSGAGNTGIYKLSGGTLNIDRDNNTRGILLGVNSGSASSPITATFNLSGTGTLNMVAGSALMIGRFDSTNTGNFTNNTFNQTGGTANVGILSMGGGGGGGNNVNSTLSLTGGVFTAQSFTRLASANDNTTLIEIGGDADVTLPAFPTGALGTDSTATITFDGGVLKNSGISTNYLGSISSAQIKNGGAFIDTTADNITITHALENFSGHTGNLTKQGSNTLILSGPNAYTGTTTVSAGILALGNLGAIANSSSVSVASGATLQASITGTYTNTAPVTLVGNGVGGGNLLGALHFNSAGGIDPVWNAPLTLGGSTRITSFGVTMNQTLGGAIGGSGDLEISSRAGSHAVHLATWTLNAASNYSGNTTILNNDGLKNITVKLGVNDALPTTTSLNLRVIAGAAGTDVHATFDLNGYSQTLAALTDTGSSNNSGTSNKRVINSSATLSTLTINNSGNVTYGTTGTRVTAGTIGGTTAAGDPADNIALVKTGTGTLTLNAANPYTGPTTINGGILALGASGSIANSSTITVGSGATLNVSAVTGGWSLESGQTLAGTGTVTGAVTITGGANLAPGSSVGTLTVDSDLTISAMAAGAGKLFYEFGPGGTSDQIAVTGTLNIGSGALGLTDFDFTNLGSLQEGNYILISSGQPINGTLDPGDVEDTLGAFDVELKIVGNNIALTVGEPSGTPYELWATGGELFDEDANGDGVANGLAFLLGAANPNVSALDLLPTVTETGGNLVLSFDMLKPANRGTATLSVEHSRDLGIADPWTTVLVTDTNSGPTNGVTFVVGSGAGTTNPVTATINASEAGGTGKLFGRLKGQE